MQKFSLWNQRLNINSYIFELLIESIMIEDFISRKEDKINLTIFIRYMIYLFSWLIGFEMKLYFYLIWSYHIAHDVQNEYHSKNKLRIET